MKKLKRLKINPERLMKDEELMTLRGGYDGPCCECKDWHQNVIGHLYGSTPSQCPMDCFIAMGTGYGTWECLV